MKLRLSVFLTVAVMLFSSLTFDVSAREVSGNQINKAEYSTVNAGYFENFEWCRVSLSNPRSSLNVRDSNGRIVAKLRHGTQVYVDAYDGGWARVNVRSRGGRLGILGWVASEYLVC